MISKIPSFETALDAFREFLAENDLPTALSWVFKNDRYQTPTDLFIVQPLPDNNSGLAQTAFANGERMNQVWIKAIARLDGGIAATIWYPRSESDRPQGWESGFKQSIATPLPKARAFAADWRWRLRSLTPSFRRYHRFRFDSILSAEEIVQGARAGLMGGSASLDGIDE